MGLAILLPKWFLLVAIMPLFMAVSYYDIIPPLLSISGADFYIFDTILIIVSMRAAAPFFLRKQKLCLYPQYLPIIFFICVLLSSTVLSYYRYGKEVFIDEILPLIRFMTQISVFFLFTYSIRTRRQYHLALKVFDYLGYAIALTVYLSVILFQFRIQFGEVQESNEIIRYFGPIGDQTAFILLLFLFKKLMEGNWIGASFIMGAILATGTRGAFLALLLGVIIILLQMRHNHLLPSKRLGLLLAVLSVVAITLFLIDFGGSRSRFIGYELEFGLVQRLTTMKLACLVFFDNIIVGVGYSGFRHFALDYGVWNEFSSLLFFSPNYIATAGNQFLQTATDAGLVGLMSFIYMMVVFLKVLKNPTRTKWKKAWCNSFAGYAWLLSLLFGNLTAAWFLPGSLISYFLWIVLAFAVLTESHPLCPNFHEIKIKNVSSSKSLTMIKE
jgi:hypothetical protein